MASKYLLLSLLLGAFFRVSFAQENLPILEFPVSGHSDSFVILLTGDGGWRPLDKAVTDYLNAKNLSVVALNIKKYLWNEKSPKQIAADLEILMETYSAKWKAPKVILIGYSMGAEVLPHSVNQLNDIFAQKVKDMILIAPDQNACFKIKLVFYVNDTNEGQPIVNELKKLKVKHAFCICDDQKISLCKSGLDGVIDYTLLTGGHHFDGDYKQLNQLIGKRLKLE